MTSGAFLNQSGDRILFSVVVCTYNRAELLADALRSLCHQTLDRSLYEIIVVDNNSTDNTRAVVERFIHYNNIRYYSETRQGLSHARDRGWQVARGEYVSYVDDDCKVPAQWLAVAKEIIEQISPGVFGGPYFAFYITSKPPWFQDRYASCVKGKEAHPLEQEYLSGANIFFRRSLLQDFDGFNPNLGMSGRKMAYGEETNLQMRIRETTDELIYYDPKLYVYHLVSPEKMTLRWIIHHFFVAGRYSYLVFRGNIQVMVGRSRLLGRAALTLLAFGWHIIRGVFRRNRTRYPYVQSYLYEYAFRHIGQLGKLYEQFKQCEKKEN